jgi:hypothetical protein
MGGLLTGSLALFAVLGRFTRWELVPYVAEVEDDEGERHVVCVGNDGRATRCGEGSAFAVTMISELALLYYLSSFYGAERAELVFLVPVTLAPSLAEDDGEFRLCMGADSASSLFEEFDSTKFLECVGGSLRRLAESLQGGANDESSEILHSSFQRLLDGLRNDGLRSLRAEGLLELYGGSSLKTRLTLRAVPAAMSVTVSEGGKGSVLSFRLSPAMEVTAGYMALLMLDELKRAGGSSLIAAFDATHGINYLGYAALQAFQTALDLYAYDWVSERGDLVEFPVKRVMVYNSDPVTRPPLKPVGPEAYKYHLVLIEDGAEYARSSLRRVADNVVKALRTLRRIQQPRAEEISEHGECLERMIRSGVILWSIVQAQHLLSALNEAGLTYNAPSLAVTLPSRTKTDSSVVQIDIKTDALQILGLSMLEGIAKLIANGVAHRLRTYGIEVEGFPHALVYIDVSRLRGGRLSRDGLLGLIYGPAAPVLLDVEARDSIPEWLCMHQRSTREKLDERNFIAHAGLARGAVEPLELECEEDRARHYKLKLTRILQDVCNMLDSSRPKPHQQQ